jgi:hypothetical protein
MNNTLPPTAPNTPPVLTAIPVPEAPNTPPVLTAIPVPEAANAPAVIPPAPPVKEAGYAPIPDLMEALVEINKSVSAAYSKFVEEEHLTTNCTPDQARAVAADILGKFLRYPLKEDSRDVCQSIPVNTHWQASDGTVYRAEEASSIILNAKDYMRPIKRTQRPGEDRKGFTPLAKKTAEELGYVLPAAPKKSK